MCGPSSQEINLQAAETGFMNQYSQAFNTNFAKQQNVLTQINHQLQPVLDRGINQYGFSAAETAALKTQAINRTGAGYKNAAVALGNQEAGMGDSTLESGIRSALKGQLASNAETALSNEDLAITQAGYAQGRQNYLTALGGMQGLAATYNPQSYANLTQTAEGQSFNQADTIAVQQAQADQAIAGGITSLVGTGLSGIAGGMGGGGAKGVLKGLSGGL